MRRSEKSAARAERFTTAVLSVFAGIGALTVTAMIMSAFAALCDLPDSIISAMSGIALAAGCFACAFCSANRRRRNGLSSGILWGIGVFAAVLLAGMLTVRVFSAGGIITKFIIILTASAIGGIKGVNTRPFLRR